MRPQASPRGLRPTPPSHTQIGSGRGRERPQQRAKAQRAGGRRTGERDTAKPEGVPRHPREGTGANPLRPVRHLLPVAEKTADYRQPRREGNSPLSPAPSSLTLLDPLRPAPPLAYGQLWPLCAPNSEGWRPHAQSSQGVQISDVPHGS